MCSAPQRRALFRHLNFQKCSDAGVLCAFWLRNVLRATTACTFSTSEPPKVARTCGVLSILTSCKAPSMANNCFILFLCALTPAEVDQTAVWAWSDWRLATLQCVYSNLWCARHSDRARTYTVDRGLYFSHQAAPFWHIHWGSLCGWGATNHSLALCTVALLIVVEIIPCLPAK